MSTDKTISQPVRMPTELLDKIREAEKRTGLSQQDVMRLCLAIGLVDLKAIKQPLSQLIKDAAKDQGISYLEWFKNRIDEPPLPPPTEPNSNRIKNIVEVTMNDQSSSLPPSLPLHGQIEYKKAIKKRPKKP